MLHKRHDSVITLAILLAFVGVPKPAKAFLLTQSKTAPAAFSLPDELSQDAAVQIAASSGISGKIQLVDLPDHNDTRQAFNRYPLFQSAKFSTGSNTVKLEEDSTDAMVSQLGKNGIGYAVANDVIGRDDVKIITMDQTQPFSQPLSVVYQETETLNEAAQAYLGFATTEEGQQIVDERVGSLATATGAVAIATSLAESSTDYNTDAGTAPQANPKGETPEDDIVADTDLNNEGNLEGSGDINPQVEGSGDVNSEVEGSGDVNPEVEGSGNVNPDLIDSGSPNLDIEDSGEVNPDLEDSGKPLSSDNLEIDGTIISEAAVADANEINPNTVEGETSEVETTAKKDGWWWWLIPLILGIPLLAAIFAFGGRKKSDQEPAISNIPNPNPLNRSTGLSGGANGGDVSAVSANISSNLGNVSENAVGTNSKLGNAAIATGGAAAANFVGDKKRAERDTDIDIDLDEPESVTDIPSNPVAEFTGQETKLQIDVEDDLDDISAGFTNDMSASTTALGGAGATSEFLNNVEDSTDIELDTAEIMELETEQTTDLINRNIDDVTNSANDIELDQVSEVNIGKEFSGDFVLDEETQSTVPSEQDTAIDAPEITSDINLDLTSTTDGREEVATPELDVPDLNLDDEPDLNIVDRTTQAGETAIAGGAAATASGLFNQDQDNEQSVDNQSAVETTSTEVDNSLEGMTLDEAVNMPELSLEEITLDDADTPVDASLAEITLDDADTPVDASLEEITLDDVTNSSDLSLEDITLDDVQIDSTTNLSDESDANLSSQNPSLDDLGFKELESPNSLTADPLSNKTAEITSLSDDQSNDMNNISEWLDSLETPKQSTENISEWLDTINEDDQVDSGQKEQNQNTTSGFAEEVDDISFKFLEDLLDRNPNSNQDNQ